MRRLAKGVIPSVLVEHGASWLADYLSDSESATKKFRYRHAAIKAALREETGWKCVYCESKIGHNTPGDIEHKVPSSKEKNLHFDWSNLTVACTECNRRKSDYYEKGAEFLDPYSDDVEECLLHLGPIVYWVPGHQRAEVTVRTLELDTSSRIQLLDRKREKLEKARALLDLVSGAAGDLLRTLREDELERMSHPMAEYSAMVRSYVGAAHTRATRK